MMKILKKIIFCGAFFQSLFSISLDIGQRFILSLPRTYNFEVLDDWLVKTKPAGIMLEAWHTTDRRKIKVVVKHLQEKVKELGLPPLFVAIDLEGGIVSRFNEAGGFNSVPSPYRLAQAGRSACFLGGFLIGKQLSSIGVNVDFAPLLDFFDQNNYVLATRCFDGDPQKIVSCAEAFSHGLLSAGVVPVIKHFPGLGLGSQDTHLHKLHINFNEDELKRQLDPFELFLLRGFSAVMVSHAVYEYFGTGPASQSSKVVQFLKEKNSDVLCITDDISMKAFQHSKNLLDDAEVSLQAGFHLLIYSDTPNKQIALLNNLQKRMKKVNDTIHAQCIEKTDNYKRKNIKSFTDNSVKIDEAKLASDLAEKVLQQRYYIDDLAHKKVVLLSVDLPKMRSTDQWFTYFPRSLTPESSTYLGRLMRTQLRNFDEILCNPVDKKSIAFMKKFVESVAQQCDYVFLQTFFYGQGVWNEVQAEWLSVLSGVSDKLVIFSLGHPYEKNMLTKTAHIFELGSFHNPLIKAAWSCLQREPLHTGADYFIQTLDKYLKNKRFGLICNNASTVFVNGKEGFLPDALMQWAQEQDDSSQLSALFCPEHGLLGTVEAGALVNSETGSRWGCPIFSLHGKIRQPTSDMLRTLDTLIIDLQEVGVRCYTYLSTMALALEAAALEHKDVIILDRPNPLIVWRTQGPMLSEDCKSFLGEVYTPFLHGKTLGGIARDINKKIGAPLTVLGNTWDGMSVDDYFAVNFKKPSPNLMSLDSLFVYPMTVFIEGTNYSEGRGTMFPFQQIGAPWVDRFVLAQRMNDKRLPGIYFEPVKFTPVTISGIVENPKHNSQQCEGIFLHIIDKKRVKPMRVAQEILQQLFDLYPAESECIKLGKSYFLDLLVGNKTWRQQLMKS